MAKVTVVPPTAPEFILTLSLEEAMAIHRIIGNHVIGAGPIRKHTDSIYYAIEGAFKEAGVKADYGGFHGEPKIRVGSS